MSLGDLPAFFCHLGWEAGGRMPGGFLGGGGEFLDFCTCCTCTCLSDSFFCFLEGG